MGSKMIATLVIFACTLALASPAAAAQEIDTGQLDRWSAANRDRVILNKTLRDNRRNVRGTATQRTSGASAANTRATCADKRRLAGGLSAAKARRLYTLCARAGH